LLVVVLSSAIAIVHPKAQLGLRCCQKHTKAPLSSSILLPSRAFTHPSAPGSRG
jgi:hypothetical protein